MMQLLRFVDAREYEALAGCRADEIGGTDVESDIAGVVMERSAVVNPPMYLRALFKRVGQLCPSVEWVTRSLTPTHIELLKDNYDIVIVAAGPGFPTLWQATEAKDSIPNSSANGKVDDDANRLTDAYRLPFKYTRGQNLIYRQSDFETQFKEPVLRGEYLVPTESAVGCPSEASAAGDPDMAHNYEMQSSLSHTSMQSHSPYLIYGATHEYGDSIRDLSAPADADAAHELLSDRMGQLHPELIGKTPVGVNWGIRVMSERSHLGKVPVVGRHPRFENVWLVGGLGARGLIHHAIVGEILAEAALAGEEDVVPKEMRLSTQIHGLDRMLARERLKEKNSLTKESVKEH
jgi:glycine/D-amino acid oxidase-like deaminating enzyme